MITKMKLLSLCVLVGISLVAQGGTPEEWNHFNSSKAFTVDYPSTWFRHGAADDRLDILSSKYGTEAVGIKRNEAEIMVFEAQGSPAQSLSKIIDFYTQGAVVLQRRDVTNKEATKDYCSTFRQVVIKEEAVPVEDVPGPVPHVIYSDFFCEVSGRKFVTILKNWQGDKRQEIFQRIALNVAKSLRLSR